MSGTKKKTPSVEQPFARPTGYLTWGACLVEAAARFGVAPAAFAEAAEPLDRAVGGDPFGYPLEAGTWRRVAPLVVAGRRVAVAIYRTEVEPDGHVRCEVVEVAAPDRVVTP
jgi:hypothetical protein